ncbi:MAG: glycosyltransferase involved in cell wall biosynthesis [Glaciecola sp.]|jgi:glycosyltransferase involved in cell wall biosynthesis
MNIIVHIISSLNVGGAEMMLFRLLKESATKPNDRHIVISLLPKGELQDRYQAEGIEVFMLDIKHKPFYSCKKIISIIKHFNPRVIQTWMYHADFIGGILARLSGSKNIYWGIRNTHVPKGSKFTYLLMKLLALLSFVIPKKIICVADSAKISHIAEGYCSKKMMTISNGYDFNNLVLNRVRNVRKEFGINDQTLVIGCLGRFHSDKGQDLFIQAVAKFPKNSFKFMLVGRGCDWNNKALVDCIDEYNLKGAFILAGETGDVASHLSAFDMFCMPSRTEGFPNSLAEAMAMELPCVGFSVGDADKLRGEGVDLVEPNDIEGLFLKLENFTKYTHIERKSLGRKAANRVREKFSIEKIYDEYRTVYKIV